MVKNFVGVRKPCGKRLRGTKEDGKLAGMLAEGITLRIEINTIAKQTGSRSGLGLEPGLTNGRMSERNPDKTGSGHKKIC